MIGGAIRELGTALSVLALCALALLSPIHHARGADAAPGGACPVTDAASATGVSADGQHCTDGETGNRGGRHGQHGAATCLICNLAETAGTLLPSRGAELKLFFSQAVVRHPGTPDAVACMVPERSARPRGPPIGT